MANEINRHGKALLKCVRFPTARNSIIRLFAGICRNSTKSKPFRGRSRGEILDAAKTPFRIARLEIRIERKIRRRGLDIVLQPRAVEDQRTVRREQPGRAGDQAERCAPRTDVHHVDVQHGVGARSTGQSPRAGVDHDRLAQVRQAGRIRARRQSTRAHRGACRSAATQGPESAPRTRPHARRSRSQFRAPCRWQAAIPSKRRQSARGCAAQPERSGAGPTRPGPRRSAGRSCRSARGERDDIGQRDERRPGHAYSAACAGSGSL